MKRNSTFPAPILGEITRNRTMKRLLVAVMLSVCAFLAAPTLAAPLPVPAKFCLKWGEVTHVFTTIDFPDSPAQRTDRTKFVGCGNLKNPTG